MGHPPFPCSEGNGWGGGRTQGRPLAAGAGSDPTRGLFNPASPSPPPACPPAFPQQGPREAQTRTVTTTARSQLSPAALQTPHHCHPDPKPSGPGIPRGPLGAAATPRAPPSATAASGPARSQAGSCRPAAGPYVRGVPVCIHEHPVIPKGLFSFGFPAALKPGVHKPPQCRSTTSGPPRASPHALTLPPGAACWSKGGKEDISPCPVEKHS